MHLSFIFSNRFQVQNNKMHALRTHIESPEPTPGCSQPLHIKRLEQALDLRGFLAQYPDSDGDDAEDSDLNSDDDSQDASDENAIKMDILMNGT